MSQVQNNDYTRHDTSRNFTILPTDPRVRENQALLHQLLSSLMQQQDLLCEAVLQEHTLPCYCDGVEKGDPRLQVVRQIRQIHYEDGQGSMEVKRFTGLVACSRETMHQVEQVNGAKEALEQALPKMDALFVRHEQHQPLSDYLLEQLGHARLHRLQSYRRLGVCEGPVLKAKFFWASNSKVEPISIDRLRMHLQDHPSTHASRDLDKLARLPIEEKLAWIKERPMTPKANLLYLQANTRLCESVSLDHPQLVLDEYCQPFKYQKDAQGQARLLAAQQGSRFHVVRLMQQNGFGILEQEAYQTPLHRWVQRMATMPIFYLDPMCDKLPPPRIQTLPAEKVKAGRSRNKTKLADQPYLHSIPVYRYQSSKDSAR